MIQSKLKKYKIVITFLNDNHGNPTSPFKSMMLKTKPVTEERANQIATEHARSAGETVQFRYTLTPLKR